MNIVTKKVGSALMGVALIALATPAAAQERGDRRGSNDRAERSRDRGDSDRRDRSDRSSDRRSDRSAGQPGWGNRGGAALPRDNASTPRADRRDYRRDNGGTDRSRGGTVRTDTGRSDGSAWDRNGESRWNNDRDGRWNTGRSDRRDNGWNDNNRRDDRRYDDRRYDDRRGGTASDQWYRNWRQDRRYDYDRYRNDYRERYRLGTYYSPYRNYGYTRFRVGVSINSGYYGSRYWIRDPYYYRLPPVPSYMRWVRYYDAVVLVDLRRGRVVDVIYNFFW